MWTPTTRRQHSRAGLRYETDLTDAEWAVVEPLLPEPASCGRPALWPMREILNGIFYVLRGGIAWRLLPKDLPPKSTVFGYFSRWRDAGVFLRINHHLLMADRERVGRDASPTAAVLDSQSVNPCIFDRPTTFEPCPITQTVPRMKILKSVLAATVFCLPLNYAVAPAHAATASNSQAGANGHDKSLEKPTGHMMKKHKKKM